MKRDIQNIIEKIALVFPLVLASGIVFLGVYKAISDAINGGYTAQFFSYRPMLYMFFSSATIGSLIYLALLIILLIVYIFIRIVWIKTLSAAETKPKIFKNKRGLILAIALPFLFAIIGIAGNGVIGKTPIESDSSSSTKEAAKYADATQWFMSSFITYLQNLYEAEIIYKNIEDHKGTSDYLALLNQLRSIKSKYLSAESAAQSQTASSDNSFFRSIEKYYQKPTVANVSNALVGAAAMFGKNTQNDINQLESMIVSQKRASEIERALMVILSRSKEMRNGVWAAVWLANTDICSSKVLNYSMGCLNLKKASKDALNEKINETFGVMPVSFEKLHDILEMLRHTLVYGTTFEDGCKVPENLIYKPQAERQKISNKQTCPFCHHESDITSPICSYCKRKFVLLETITIDS